MAIYSHSPITLAIFKLFQELEDYIAKNNQNLPHGAIKAYIFGGCAFHIHTNARGSNDIDAEIQAIQQLKKQDILLFLENNDIEYLDQNNLETNLEFDRSFNTSLASVDPDYVERAIPLVSNRIVEVYLVSGLDLAISKLARLSDRDIQDIKELYLNNKFSLESFKKSANNAEMYYATPEQLYSNIQYMVSILSELRG
ncbi:hypothetical protein KTJ16_14115 [Acinetobacter bereziniae]|nr:MULTISPECIES: DUF6036 family nucleotidyltransferase [Acinetobacter]MBJ8422476.1 hypothetical protein [Acinetobacter bereziniae]MCU4473010.1 hypothetical protein [Acinetobacter bereziniae]MCU4538718.1 hypothetical protein [Acinetobacter bereziniae]MCU4542299.1 hypothetical protein [Acinetobacter bereziniae]MCU4624947.1 hypothetical protein [Acinetobacter bereziniae]